MGILKLKPDPSPAESHDAQSKRREPRDRDQIIAAHPIAEFVRSRGFELRAEGQNFVTNGCPVSRHEKKGHRPVTIYSEKQSWYCHDCKQGGSVLDWVMQEKNIPFVDAVRELDRAAPSPRNVAFYDYTDENGQLLYQTVRQEPKDFFYRRPNGKGDWINDIKDVRRVLYRLPEVLQAIRNGFTIYIAEGEKDVDALRENGFHATCNPMGAGKNIDQYIASLRDADLVVIADADKDGRPHAQNWASKLHGVASSVRVIELREKDSALFFEKGGTAKELLAIADNAPQWTPRAALEEQAQAFTQDQIIRAQYTQFAQGLIKRCKTEPIERIESFASWQIEKLHGQSSNGCCEHFLLSKLLQFDPKHDPNCLVGFRWLVRGGAALWAGGSGYGKSSLEMQLAIYWACGVACFGLRPVRPLKSLIVQCENDEGDTAEQLQGVLKGIDSVGDLDLEAKQEMIKKNVIIYRIVGKTGVEFLHFLDNQLQIDRPDLVWIDPLFGFAGCDLLNPEKTGRFLREGLFPIADKRRVCMNVLHHIGKPPKDSAQSGPISELDYQYLGFGTSEIQNAFRAVNILVPVKKGGGFKLVFSKRGERAGAMDHEEQWAREIFISHSKEGICWLQCGPPSDIDGANEKFSKEDIMLEMSYDHPLKTDVVYKRCYRERNAKRTSFYKLWGELKEENLIKKQEEGWVLCTDQLRTDREPEIYQAKLEPSEPREPNRELENEPEDENEPDPF